MSDSDRAPWNEGMTLRDYFAAQALQGILASDALMRVFANLFEQNEPEKLGQMAYEIADGMLKAREQ